jgi:hypothetical protein
LQIPGLHHPGQAGMIPGVLSSAQNFGTRHTANCAPRPAGAAFSFGNAVK